MAWLAAGGRRDSTWIRVTKKSADASEAYGVERQEARVGLAMWSGWMHRSGWRREAAGHTDQVVDAERLDAFDLASDAEQLKAFDR